MKSWIWAGLIGGGGSLPACRDGAGHNAAQAWPPSDWLIRDNVVSVDPLLQHLSRIGARRRYRRAYFQFLKIQLLQHVIIV